jgi:hypothetical protein
MEKSRIRDKHPGSATLIGILVHNVYVKYKYRYYSARLSKLHSLYSVKKQYLSINFKQRQLNKIMVEKYLFCGKDHTFFG